MVSLEAKLGKLSNSGNTHSSAIVTLATESIEHHSTAMRLQRTLAQECQAIAQRQERLAAELAAAQRAILELRQAAAPIDEAGSQP